MKHLYFAAALALGVAQASANNIVVENVALSSQNLANQTAVISFDLAWENSWRLNTGVANYDGAWVFAKYRVGSDPWQQVIPDAVGTAPGVTRNFSAEDRGALVFRSTLGSGSVDGDGLTITWDYGAAGVDDAAVVEVRVFAVEMVYAPTDLFDLGVPGNSGAEQGAFYNLSGTDRIPLAVSSGIENNAIQVEATTSILSIYYDDVGGGAAGDQAGPIPAAYPFGYGAYWVMKYEVSQQQWVDFFNTLTPTQQTANDITDAAGKNSDAEVARNGVSWTGTGEATTTQPDLPVSFVSNERALAYLDWAGLRPMSEGEFERYARGELTSSAGDYAWLDNTLATVAYTLSSPGTPAEAITNAATGTGNAAYATTAGSIAGPVRVGAFAASVAPDREDTGGSYYGVMELSGNLTERAMTVGNAAGRSFEATEGDGALTAAGAHDVATWDADGYGRRGGSYADPASKLLVSDRSEAAVTSGGNAAATIGFRGVRNN